MHIPPYDATIFFELYKPGEGGIDDYYVQLFYKNTTAEVIEPINIPKCGTKCPLKSFREFYKDVIPTEKFKVECGVPDR